MVLHQGSVDRKPPIRLAEVQGRARGEAEENLEKHPVSRRKAGSRRIVPEGSGSEGCGRPDDAWHGDCRPLPETSHSASYI